MAEPVDSMPTVNQKYSRYPWHEWLDGRVWKLKVGEDFSVPNHAFRSACYCAAKNVGKKATIRFDKHGFVYIQATARQYIQATPGSQ